ncbi:MAG: ABC transporter ATP-binding protein [Spirochaetaceae bacterium]|jgi:oligopeptide transport system ATP-binding protein|nr:ABC transporter ATP-binding protein [Spirochaetaceae bacterium]
MGEQREGADIIVSVKNLEVSFNLRGQILHAVRNVSLDIFRGESLAIVGESGSGKSVFCKTFMGLLDANGSLDSGEIRYYREPSAEGINLAKLKTDREWQPYRGGAIAMVMQDPLTSLNPLKTVGSQIVEAIEIHQKLKGRSAKEKAIACLEDVGIAMPEKRFSQFPHEFSGGMRQRVVIAIAIACNPRLLICDEPTTALDVTIEAQILSLIKGMKQKYQLTTLYITHDLGVVANVADRIVVMYAGDFVEIGTAEDIFYNPRHPYTWALLSSMPSSGVKGEELFSIRGTPPSLFQHITGDAFAPRNPYALKIDFVRRPPLFQVSPTHFVRSWLLDPRAPLVAPPEIIRRKARV